MCKLKDLTGQVFGHLTVVEYAYNDGKNTYWRCRCDCGKVVEVQRAALITGATTSCGHRMIEVNQKLAKESKLNEAGLKKLKEESFVEGSSLKGMTRKISSNNTTGVKGVSFKQGKYEASIKFRGKGKYLGRFATLEEAKAARLKAEEEIYKPILDRYKHKK